MAGRIVTELRGSAAGESFEHFILLELMAAKDYLEIDWEISFWRTKLGHEVDFVLNTQDYKGPLGIECKLSTQISKADCKGLINFLNANENASAIIVCFEEFCRRITIEHTDKTYQIEIIPWKLFLKKLWLNNFEEYGRT